MCVLCIIWLNTGCRLPASISRYLMAMMPPNSEAEIHSVEVRYPNTVYYLFSFKALLCPIVDSATVKRHCSDSHEKRVLSFIAKLSLASDLDQEVQLSTKIYSMYNRTHFSFMPKFAKKTMWRTICHSSLRQLLATRYVVSDRYGPSIPAPLKTKTCRTSLLQCLQLPPLSCQCCFTRESPYSSHTTMVTMQNWKLKIFHMKNSFDR